MTGRHRKPATLASLAGDIAEAVRGAVRTVVDTVAGIPQPGTATAKADVSQPADRTDD